MSGHLAVEVWGDFALFSQPALKVERVSYPVMTPAAARGMLESIFWRPEFEWQVREIWVLKPIHYISLLRNELQNRQSERSARGWERRGGGYYAEEDRSQRHTLALRDVHYIIQADLKLRPHATDPAAKYRAQFRRRVARGRSFQQPYFGCREYAAWFAEPAPNVKPIDISMELGRILFDQRFDRNPKGQLQFWDHGEDGRGLIRGQVTPIYFEAHLDRGVLRIPAELYEEREPRAS